MTTWERVDKHRGDGQEIIVTRWRVERKTTHAQLCLFVLLGEEIAV